LHIEDVLQVTVIPLRPELEAILNVAELDSDAHTIAGPANASVQDCRHVQPLADRLEVVALAAQ
jgi:hypothetical protein